LDFNSGTPEVLYDGQIYFGSSVATISDSMGNYLFCCGGGFVYDKVGIMQNGADMMGGGYAGFAIVKHPGLEDIYYIFNAQDPDLFEPKCLCYSIVDLKLNGGLGAVTEKNIQVEATWDISDQIAIVKKDNTNHVWVVVWKNEEDAVAAFLIDENGFHPEPVISPMPDGDPSPYWQGEDGWIKISFDKKYCNYSPLQR
jgi:hypothetical protein